MKRCFIDCSERQPSQQTGDLPMTTPYDYESTDASTPAAGDAAYTGIQKPQRDYDNDDAAPPVYYN